MGRDRDRIHDRDAPYFLTCTMLQSLPLFAQPANARILLDSLTFLQDQDDWCSMAPSASRTLPPACRRPDLAETMASFKSYTAGQIDKRLSERRSRVLELLAFRKARHQVDREHQVWQEGSHPELIQGEAMMHQKLEYIHNNPVARGYVDDPLHWRYSSARNYSGQKGLFEVVTQW